MSAGDEHPSPGSAGERDGRTTLDDLLVGRLVTERIARGPSEVLFLADDADPTVVTTVVKTTCDAPPPGSDARTLYRLHERLVGQGGAGAARDVAPRPLGWGEHPDLFAYEYAEGVPVKERIEALASAVPAAEPAWPDELSEIARSSGALLARFHGALASGAPETVVTGRLHQACRRATVGAAAVPTAAVRSLCDSGPHNLIVRDDGDIQLIDLPTDERWTFAEFDIGVLVHRTARRAAIAFRSTASAADVHRVFTEPLCEGYAGVADRQPDRAEVLASFAASSFVFARRSLTIGHPHASLRYARRDLAWGGATIRAARGLA